MIHHHSFLRLQKERRANQPKQTKSSSSSIRFEVSMNMNRFFGHRRFAHVKSSLTLRFPYKTTSYGRTTLAQQPCLSTRPSLQNIHLSLPESFSPRRSFSAEKREERADASSSPVVHKSVGQVSAGHILGRGLKLSRAREVGNVWRDGGSLARDMRMQGASSRLVVSPVPHSEVTRIYAYVRVQACTSRWRRRVFPYSSLFHSNSLMYPLSLSLSRYSLCNKVDLSFHI